MSTRVTTYRLNIEFYSEDDWNEMKDVLEDWEMTGIARVDAAGKIERWYNGSTGNFSAWSGVDSTDIENHKILGGN